MSACRPWPGNADCYPAGRRRAGGGGRVSWLADDPPRAGRGGGRGSGADTATTTTSSGTPAPDAPASDAPDAGAADTDAPASEAPAPACPRSAAAAPGDRRRLEPAVVPDTAPTKRPHRPLLPVIDTWRVAPDGEALVAGTGRARRDRSRCWSMTSAVASGDAAGLGRIRDPLHPGPEPQAQPLVAVHDADRAAAVAVREMVALGPVDRARRPAAEPPAEAVAPLRRPAAEASRPRAFCTDEGAVVLQDAGRRSRAPMSTRS